MSGWSPQVVIDLESYWAKTCVKLKFPVRQGSIEHFALIRVEHRVLCSDTRDSGTEQDLPETFRQGVSENPCAAWFLPFYSKNVW